MVSARCQQYAHRDARNEVGWDAQIKSDITGKHTEWHPLLRPNNARTQVNRRTQHFANIIQLLTQSSHCKINRRTPQYFANITNPERQAYGGSNITNPERQTYGGSHTDIYAIKLVPEPGQPFKWEILLHMLPTGNFPATQIISIDLENKSPPAAISRKYNV